MRIFLLKIHNKKTLSPFVDFGVFKYARAVKQKVWNEAENRERDWGRDAKNIYARLRAQIRLLCHALPKLLILRKKKNRLFCSLFV